MSKDRAVLREQAWKPMAAWRELPIRPGPGPFTMFAGDEDVGENSQICCPSKLGSIGNTLNNKNPKSLVRPGGKDTLKR